MSSRRAAPDSDYAQYRPLPAPSDSTYHHNPVSDNHMSPPYERYGPSLSQQPLSRWANDQEAPEFRAPLVQHSEPAPTLPFFEAAIARARGQNAVYPVEPLPLNMHQPLPSYAAPADPNHPDLAVGLLQSNTIRMAMDGGHLIQSLSRSPSPVEGRDYLPGEGSVNADRWKGHQSDEQEYRNSLLGEGVLDVAHRGDHHDRWDGKTSSLELDGLDDGDLALPPFLGMHALPRSEKFHAGDQELTQKNEYSPGEADLAASTTQHFGPAPMGRVGRRTHNAEGGRRIRHTATLDENGFFAVDMPIPTRLAQFLPFKGVEEQKCTRCVLALCADTVNSVQN